MNRISQYISREKALLVLIGICGAVVLWGSIVLLYGAWDVLGGR